MKKLLLIVLLVCIAVAILFYIELRIYPGTYMHDLSSIPGEHASSTTSTTSTASTSSDMGNNNQPGITYINTSGDRIQVTLPYPGAVTGKEFAVIGTVRGWFFEGSFPVLLYDEKGTLIAHGAAKSLTDWMVDAPVQFRADIKVPANFIGKAKLVLQKDNPSDMREYDASISFPITVEY